MIPSVLPVCQVLHDYRYTWHVVMENAPFSWYLQVFPRNGVEDLIMLRKIGIPGILLTSQPHASNTSHCLAHFSRWFREGTNADMVSGLLLTMYADSLFFANTFASRVFVIKNSRFCMDFLRASQFPWKNCQIYQLSPTEVFSERGDGKQ